MEDEFENSFRIIAVEVNPEAQVEPATLPRSECNSGR